MLSVMWIAVMVLGPGGSAERGLPVEQSQVEQPTVRPIALGTPTRRYFGGPAVVVRADAQEQSAADAPKREVSGVLVSEAIAVPGNAMAGGGQVTVVGAEREGPGERGGLADASGLPAGVIAQSEQLFRAFGKGRYKNFGYTELLEPRQVGPFVGTPIFGPFGPGAGGLPAIAELPSREELDRLKQERIYQMFESLRPVEDRFPKPAGR